MESILITAARDWITQGAPATWPCTHLHEEGLDGLFFAGEPYQGRPTRVFAWLGLPQGASAGQRVPGVVLIHGGGGTAFARWVRWWNARGYAAIAMDTCGAMPFPDTGIVGSADWPRHSYSGPPGWGGFNQMDQPLQDQWAYHAAAAVVKAHSLLSAQPEVDPDRIGVTGISWGGFLTCLTAGIDSRFRCAAPVYGCGFVSETSIWTENGSFSGITASQFRDWQTHWDPAAVLPQAKMPMLWLNGSNDFAYWPPIWQKSALTAGGPRQLCLKVRWPHGHIPAAEENTEIVRFFQAHLLDGRPLLTLSPLQADGRLIRVCYHADRPPLCASLVVTRDEGPWPERQWHQLPAELLSGEAAAQAVLPDGTTAAYLSLLSEDWFYTTSDLFLPATS
ncbi:MAG: prolyl oligopeptidase family serine peptidase [Ruminococcaceae bacterium]|nr:prolyl oligopeptidase family serine peptidase [Oscillospiraceae bacterium]